jgi:hypothetical protein
VPGPGPGCSKQLLQLLREPRLLQVDLVLLGSVLSTCERLHRWRSALEVFHLGLQVTDVQQLPVQQILPSCHHLLATCSKASRWSVGLQLLQQLELRQLAPDGVTFAVMVEAMSCSARWRDALLVVEGMWRRKVGIGQNYYKLLAPTWIWMV